MHSTRTPPSHCPCQGSFESNLPEIKNLGFAVLSYSIIKIEVELRLYAMFSVFDLHTILSFVVWYCRNMKLTSVIKAARFEAWFPSDWPSNTRVPEDVSFLVYVSVDGPVWWPGHHLPSHLVVTIAVSTSIQYVQEWADGLNFHQNLIVYMISLEHFLKSVTNPHFLANFFTAVQPIQKIFILVKCN